MHSLHTGLIFGLLLGSSMVVAQQPPGGTPPKPAQATRAKRASSGKAHAAPAAMRVDVINGTEKRTQVFRAEESSSRGERKTVGSSARRRRTQRGTKAEPAVTRVEIFNGETAYTKTFTGAAEEASGPGTQRTEAEAVVVGIANGGMSSKNGRLQPVVTGVASSESKSEAGKTPVVVGIASSGVEVGRAVAKPAAGEALRPPKRRPYRGPSSNP